MTACAPSTPSSSSDYKPAVVPIHVDTVKERDIPIYIETLGNLKPAGFVELRPQVNGMLEEINFNEGDIVKKGQPLFVIDPQLYQIKLQEAQAQLQQDETSLEASKKKLERYQTLAKKDLISQQEWDELNTLVLRSEAQIKADEARLASAQYDLQHCTIVSPIEGKTGRVSAHIGNIVSSSQAESLLSIANVKHLSVEFNLTQAEFQKLVEKGIKIGVRIEVRALNNLSQILPGELTFLDHSFDNKSGLIHARGKINNESLQLLPGQAVKVRIPITSIPHALVIPQKAVKINQKGPYVYLVKEEMKVELRQITTGEEFNDEIVVIEGLAVGDQIVVEGHLRLRPGVEVQIVTPQDQL